MSEAGFWLTQFVVAVSHIKKLSPPPNTNDDKRTKVLQFSLTDQRITATSVPKNLQEPTQANTTTKLLIRTPSMIFGTSEHSITSGIASLRYSFLIFIFYFLFTIG